jgi:ribosomal protein S20
MDECESLCQNGWHLNFKEIINMLKIKNTLFVFLLLNVLFGFSATSVAAGKIENATLEEILAAIDTTIERSEKTLAALESGADKETVLGLLRDTKQIAKEIHATRKAAVYKSKAGTLMKKARSATKKDDMDAAKEHVAKGLEFYKKLKEIFHGN